MNLNKEEDRTAWKPFLDVILSLCVSGDNADFFILNPERIYSSRNSCRAIIESYGITDADKLSEILSWMAVGNGSKEYLDMRNTLSLMSLTERNSYIQIEKHSPEYKYKLSIVNHYMGRLPSSGIDAYSYGWAMFYCYAGKELEYMKEEEKWEYVGSILQKVLKSYSSWREFIHAFAVGRLFHSSTLSADISRQTRASLIKLLVSPLSPIHKAHTWK